MQHTSSSGYRLGFIAAGLFVLLVLAALFIGLLVGPPDRLGDRLTELGRDLIHRELPRPPSLAPERRVRGPAATVPDSDSGRHP